MRFDILSTREEKSLNESRVRGSGAQEQSICAKYLRVNLRKPEILCVPVSVCTLIKRFSYIRR